MNRTAWALAVLVFALGVGGCAGSGTPTPTPGAMDDVIANLVLRGITVHRLVSGDPGCPSSPLHSNAVSLEVAILDQSALHQVYLFRWRRQSDFDAASEAFAACVAEYESLHPGMVVSQLENPPWRSYGPTWNDMLETRLADALRATGGE